DRYREVADGDALQDAVETHVVELEERKAVDHDAEQAQDDCPLGGVPYDLPARRAARQPGLDGKHRRDTHQEHESRKHEVGGGQTVPGGVIHELPRSMAAVVVDHDHERDRDPARHVQRQQPPGGLTQLSGTRPRVSASRSPRTTSRKNGEAIRVEGVIAVSAIFYALWRGNSCELIVAIVITLLQIQEI